MLLWHLYRMAVPAIRATKAAAPVQRARCVAPAPLRTRRAAPCLKGVGVGGVRRAAAAAARERMPTPQHTPQLRRGVEARRAQRRAARRPGARWRRSCAARASAPASASAPPGTPGVEQAGRGGGCSRRQQKRRGRIRLRSSSAWHGTRCCSL
ncbi:hypothetical protein JKP88DRAFT_232663, partial [Tribonema minus]